VIGMFMEFGEILFMGDEKGNNTATKIKGIKYKTRKCMYLYQPRHVAAFYDILIVFRLNMIRYKIWCDMIYHMTRYDIWYDMIRYDIRYDIYDIIYGMVWYDIYNI